MASEDRGDTIGPATSTHSYWRNTITAKPTFSTTAYRYPRERFILALTLILVFLVIALTATATICLSAVFILGMVVISYRANRVRHRQLLERALQVMPQDTPRLATLTTETIARLQVESVQVFVAPHDFLNAYTFGLSSPKVVVLYSSLLKVMDEDEMRFILGHELGHVRLGHTELNSLIGGMAGIPSPPATAVLLTMAFLWWNRTCEHSADRAGLLACGKLHKAISALVKLTAGAKARTPADLEQALRRIQAEDDHAISNLAEALGTHPMTIRRIDELRSYAASDEYRRLKAQLDRNVIG